MRANKGSQRRVSYGPKQPFVENAADFLSEVPARPPQ